MKVSEYLKKFGDKELPKAVEEKLTELFKPKRWKPQKSEYYYCIESYDTICGRVCENTCLDLSNYFSHNCFETEEGAEFEIEKRKVYNELLTFAEENDDNKIDFVNQLQEKYSISYSGISGNIYIYCAISYENIGQIYFSSIEIAQKAIYTIGADRIKKYLFGIKE